MTKMSHFQWNSQRSKAATLLGAGLTQQEAAKQIGIERRTILRWLKDTEFSAEVDRLSIMTEVSSRAERLRIANRIVREKTKADIPHSDKDILDWLKFAASETSGISILATY